MTLRLHNRSNEEKYKDAEEYIDKIFPFFPERGDFFPSNIIEKATEQDVEQRRPILDCQSEIVHLLTDLKYIKQGSSGNLLYQLTDLGRAAKSKGGHSNFVKAQHIAKALLEKEERLRLEELELNVKNMRKQLQDYEANNWKANTNLIISIISALIALVALIVTIVKD